MNSIPNVKFLEEVPSPANSTSSVKIVKEVPIFSPGQFRRSRNYTHYFPQIIDPIPDGMYTIWNGVHSLKQSKYLKLELGIIVYNFLLFIINAYYFTLAARVLTTSILAHVFKARDVSFQE